MKWFHFPPPPSGMPNPMDAMTMASGTIELLCGALLVLGLFTRGAAFIASGMCAVGYFWVHAKGSFFPALNGGEGIMLYCFIFLYLAAAGGGAWSVDAQRGKP